MVAVTVPGGSLVVITGPPGAGKSTVAAQLVERFEPSALVEGDALFAFVRRGWVEPWLPESQAQNEMVIRAAAGAAGRFAQGGYATVYDGVVGPWFLPVFAAATGLAELDYVVLLPTVEQCVEQVATRADHPFSDEAATRKMHAEFAKAEVDERHVIRELDGAVEEIVERLGHGSLRVGTGRRQGYHSVTPRIVVDDLDGQVEFLRAVFDAEGEVEAGRPAELRIGDSLVMVSPAGERDRQPAFLYVYVDDADATHQRALAAGAEELEPPGDTPYGDRRAMVRDPFGNMFQIATVTR
jgi:uncharacterized glyoxalase superfamily protein PhnB